jgi:hypothetical protein
VLVVLKDLMNLGADITPSKNRRKSIMSTLSKIGRVGKKAIFSMASRSDKVIPHRIIE